MSRDTSTNVEMRRSFTWRMLAAAAGMASSLLLTVVVVRTLDALDAATFFAILAALSVGPLLGRLGLGSNVMRLLPAESDPESRRQIAGTHLQATFLLSCLSAPFVALAGCVGLLGHSNFLPVFVMTTLLIAIESTRLIISDIYAAAGRVHASVATMHYIRSLLALPFVAIVVFTVSGPSLVAVLATYLAVAAMQLTIALIYGRNDIAIFTISNRNFTLRKAIGQGTQLFTLELSEAMMVQGTIWLATAAFSSVAATQYSVAVTLAMQVTVLRNMSSLAVTAPPAARLWAAGKKEDVVRMLSSAATLSTLIVVIVVGLIAVLGPFAVEIAYGSSMRSAATMLLILAVSGIFEALFSVNRTMLIVTGHIAATARGALLVLGVAVPCAVAAAWLSGPIALAVVTSLGVSALSICMWLTARKLLGSAPRAHSDARRAIRELLWDPDTKTEPVDFT